MRKSKIKKPSGQDEQIILESIRERVTKKGSTQSELAMQLAAYEAIQAKIEGYKSKIAELKKQLSEAQKEARSLKNPKQLLSKPKGGRRRR